MFLLLYLFFFNKEVSGLAGQNIYDVTCYFESDKGETYNGTVNTANGTPCKNWKTYNSTYVTYYPDHNCCRNPRLGPDSEKEFHFNKPWCYVKAGYVAELCNINACVCNSGSYGSRCEHSCHCKNPGCDGTNGHCRIAGCEGNWTGQSCNVCILNRYGEKCEQICHCKTGCDHVTGLCNNGDCEEGWAGETCNECSPKRFGQTCERFCHCQYGECDNITGICYKPGCMMGWTGDSCSYMCQPGFYGDNCQSKCHCAIDGCATITGECNNPTAGCKVPWTGKNCATLFSCPDLRISSIGQLTPTIGTGYHINDTVKFICEKGNALSGPDTLLCIINDSQTGGKWNNSMPVCQNIECSKSSIHLSDNEIINTRTEIFNFGEVVNISCKKGYIGESKLSKCFQINKWTDNRPVCREKSGSHTIPAEKDGIYMSYHGLFGGVFTTIVVISAGVYIGACFYHRRRVRKHISIYEDLQFKSVQRQTVNSDDTYVELQ